MVWPLSGGAGGNACVKRESNYHATQQVYAPIGEYRPQDYPRISTQYCTCKHSGKTTRGTDIF